MPGPFEHWKLWHYVETEDTDLTTIKPTAVARPREDVAGMVNVRDYSEIMARAFGTDAENDTFSLVVYGLMDNGPAQRIITVAGILGAETFTEPFLDGVLGQKPPKPIPPATAFFEADTYTMAADNLVAASTPTASTGRVTSFIRIPTLGFQWLLLKILDLGGGGVEAGKVGLIWRPTANLQK